MSDDEDIGGSKTFNRMSGSDSSREGSPQTKRPKRSFTPTSDDGDLVVPAAGEHIDDTPPPAGQPIIRQAVAFNLGQASAASVQTYSAPTAPKPVSYFLPGQAPVAGPSSAPVDEPLPTPTLTQRSRSPSWAPPPATQPKSFSKKKKTEGKKRHFNDAFSSQTGRFKVGPGFIHDPKALTPPLANRVTGPYSSMYRMGADTTDTLATSLAGSGTPAPYLNAHQAASTSVGHPPVGATLSDSSAARRSTVSSDMTYSSSQPRASGSKMPSSKHRSSIKQSTSQRQLGQTSQASETNPQYYHRDSERGNDVLPALKGKEKTSGRSQHSSSKPRTHTQDPHSPSRSAITQHTSSGDNHTNSAPRTEHKPQGNGRQLRMVTILIDDIRSGVVDHQLAEVRVHLYERPDRFWADAQELCEQLQSSPSRIDGPARVYTLRGKYRQFFLRVTADNVDEITSSNLQVALERTLDIVVEPLPQHGVLPPPPQVPRELLSPSSDSETMGSPVPLQAHSFQGISSDEALRHLNHMVPQKRQRSRSPRGDPHQRPFAHISPLPSPSPSQTTASLPLPKGKRVSKSSYDYSRMSPRTAHYYQNYARSYNIPLPASPNTPGRMGVSQEQVDAAIVHFIKPLVEEDPRWMKYMESKGKPPRVPEILQQYQFVQDKVDELANTRTPIHWDGAPNMEIQKQHVWQILNLESPSGLDCEETLSLLRLYGPDGQRYEDSRVVDMMNDTSVPTGKPYKRFLKLLRQIDMDWKKDHPEDADSDGSWTSTGGRSTKAKTNV